MDKITVKDLVDGYNSLSDDGDERDYWLEDTVVINKYVSWSSMVTLAKAIIEASCFDEYHNIHVDSPKKDLLTLVGIFTLYTNIEFDQTNVINDYDLLAEKRLTSWLLDRIRPYNKPSFEEIVKMTYEDAITNEYESHAFITKKLMDMWPHISEAVMPLINKASDALDKVDENTFKEIVQTINR